MNSQIRSMQVQHINYRQDLHGMQHLPCLPSLEENLRRPKYHEMIWQIMWPGVHVWVSDSKSKCVLIKSPWSADCPAVSGSASLPAHAHLAFIIRRVCCLGMEGKPRNAAKVWACNGLQLPCMMFFIWSSMKFQANFDMIHIGVYIYIYVVYNL